MTARHNTLRIAAGALVIAAVLAGLWWLFARPASETPSQQPAAAPSLPAPPLAGAPPPSAEATPGSPLRRFALLGLAASGDPRSIVARALISVDGGPARAVAVGERVDGDLIVQAIHSDFVHLGKAGGPALLRLDVSAMSRASAQGPAPTPPAASPPGAERPAAAVAAKDPDQVLPRMFRGSGSADPLPGMMVPAGQANAGTPQRPQDTFPAGMAVHPLPAAVTPAGMVVAPPATPMPIPSAPAR